MPLPSIGHTHADRGIRPVWVEVPATSALRGDDVQWAFSGLEIAERDALQTSEAVLTMADDQGEGMLRHFGIGDRSGHRHWRTVTRAVLPAAAERSRIDPNNGMKDAKGGRERAEERAKAGGAVIQALRHAGVAARVDEIRVQREPFESNGKHWAAPVAG
jgi:CRISPR-associated protein Csb2